MTGGNFEKKLVPILGCMLRKCWQHCALLGFQDIPQSTDCSCAALRVYQSCVWTNTALMLTVRPAWKVRKIHCEPEILRLALQRGGILYGTVDEDSNVLVEAIYEPPQSATATSLQLERGTEEEQRADYLAKLLGCGSLFYQTPNLAFKLPSAAVNESACICLMMRPACSQAAA